MAINWEIVCGLKHRKKHSSYVLKCAHKFILSRFTVNRYTLHVNTEGET